MVCVDEREIADYEEHVPASHLLVHPPLDGLPRVMNWMMDAVKEPTLIQIDDDFVGVRVMVGSKRFIMDPDEILQIIENAASNCEELGLTTFCWAKTQNTTISTPYVYPILPSLLVANAKGFMGKARRRTFDVLMHGRADADWTLRTLLEDRAIYADQRFFFDCGMIFSGGGGSNGMITPEGFINATRIMRKRWGAHVSNKSPGWIKNRSTEAFAIRVSRWNQRAVK
jgi:hypothetical protein